MKIRAIALICAALSFAATESGTPEPAAFVTEHARSAQSFIDSVGVNVHFSYNDGPYGRSNDLLKLIRRLGVRHLRDGITPGRADVCGIDRRFASADVRFTYIAPVDVSPAMLHDWYACVGNATEAVEGANEYDISHPASDTQWVKTLRRAQINLYRDVADAPATRSIPVIGPSLTSPEAYRQVGDLSAAMTYGNMHDYFAGHEPETGGWGLGGYGSLAYNMGLARITDGQKPILSTETGYGTDTGSKRNVDPLTQANYLLRLLLEQFAAGVPRTFLYEFVDEDDGTFGHYGLLERNLTPKPAFRALASFLSVLRVGAGADTSPDSLSFRLDGAGDAERHLLLSSGPGRYDLVLWLNAPTYDPVAMRPLSAEPKMVTVTLPVPPRHAVLYTAADDTFGSHPQRIDARALHFTISTTPCVLELQTGD